MGVIFLLALLVVGSEALQEPQTCLQNGDPQMAKLLEQMLFEAKFKSERYLADRNRSEEQLQQTGSRKFGMNSVANEWLCNGFFSVPTNDTLVWSRLAMLQSRSSQEFAGVQLDRQDKSCTLPLVNVSSYISLENCPKASSSIFCAAVKYRTIDGVCNNVRKPYQGSSLQPFRRYLPAAYEDGVSVHRSLSKIGDLLPGAKQVSQLITKRDPKPEIQSEISHMVPLWAHFIYSDIAGVSLYRDMNAKCLDCCGLAKQHDECLPIDGDSPAGDSKCLPYSRIMIAPRDNCTLGPREQINMVTSYLDGSQIYGSDTTQTVNLRLLRQGKLRTRSFADTDVPPPIPKETVKSRCRSQNDFTTCFNFGNFAGDFSVSTAALFHVWVKEHNRIATELKVINPHWGDEKTFEESRRIVGAEIQHITYGEFLPIILGSQTVMERNLSLQNFGYYNGYNISADVEINNAYAMAIGLFFHTMWLDSVDDAVLGSAVELSELILNPQWLYFQDYLKSNIISSLKTSPATVSHKVSPELTEKFLRPSFSPKGQDLVAIIIQMGRDSGLNSYVEWRKFCGLSEPKDFTQLSEVMSLEASLLLKDTYTDVSDVDLFIGGLAENHLEGALVGPTFACVMTEVFQRLRQGDRFWYENYMSPAALSLDQLSEIRKVTLARVLCDNANLETIQPSAMLSEDQFDGPIIERMNLRKWKDELPRMNSPVSQETIKKAVVLGRGLAAEFARSESRKITKNPDAIAKEQTAAFMHSVILQTSPIALLISQTSNILLETSRVLLQKIGVGTDDLPEELDENTLQFLLPNIDVSQVLAIPDPKCLKREFPCDYTAKYRTISGWCNNLNFPEYGASYVPLKRLLKPVYADGFNEARNESVTGKLLPSPRRVTSVVAVPKVVPHPKFSLFLMQWGQFLDHDFTLTPMSVSPDGKALDCSDCDSARTVSINCMPIPVGTEDPFFPSIDFSGKPKCMTFARSLVGNVKLGYRQQFNQLTSFIDASQVYGSEECKSKELRTLTGGALKFQEVAGHVLMPSNPTHKDCQFGHRFDCFLAGDVRANEQIGLTSIHTIWVKEHNRIASALQLQNPNWSDEKTFQEARRIVSAFHQHLTMSEWLPKVIGLKMMDKYDLLPRKQGFYEEYDSYCDGSIANEFATAAFRFGHTLIDANFHLKFKNESSEEPSILNLKDTFQNVDNIWKNPELMFEVLTGIVGMHSQNYDRHFDETIRNHLFENSDEFSGLDLIALNIQRGRDHGLPAYTRYREFFNLSVPKTWEDLVKLNITDQDTATTFELVYESVNDIDLFMGMIAETPLLGATVGPLNAHFLGEQFNRLRRCDRHWYENGGQAGSFSLGQLAEIRKMSMAKTLCRHIPLLSLVPPAILEPPNLITNRPVQCEFLPDTDLSLWAETDFCTVAATVIERGNSKRVSPCVSCTCTTEGPFCESFKIKNCLTLINAFTAEQINNDVACVVQCQAFFNLKNA